MGVGLGLSFAGQHREHRTRQQLLQVGVEGDEMLTQLLRRGGQPAVRQGESFPNEV
jgi:hypothetical protein